MDRVMRDEEPAAVVAGANVKQVREDGSAKRTRERWTTPLVRREGS